MLLGAIEGVSSLWPSPLERANEDAGLLGVDILIYFI
jgi:hypothetical protein